MTPEQAVAHVTQTNPCFAVGEADIRGVRERVFTNVPNDLPALLRAAEPLYADGHALFAYQDEHWSYERGCADVRRVAHALAHRFGVQRGDRIALVLRNYPELPLLIFAINAIGAVAVPMNGWWTAPELRYGLQDCGARVVFAEARSAERVAPICAELGITVLGVRDATVTPHYDELVRADQSDPGWPEIAIGTDDDFGIFYSSGSTGRPKGVVLTHRGAISAVYSWLFLRELPPLIDGMPKPPDDTPLVALATTPIFHVTALQAITLQCIARGGTVVLMYKWNAEEAVRTIVRERVTVLSGVPTQTADLLEASQRLGVRLDHLVAIGSGGAKRPAAQVAPLAEAFPWASVGSGWGLTETNALGTVGSGPDYVAHPESTGRAVPPLQEIRVVDERGQSLPAGQVGELLVKGPNVMRCYLNLPEDTARTLQDGWLHTGDLGTIDATGLITIVDRKKNIIVRGGENVACLEVEGALHAHPDVLEACVFSIPDEHLGEIVGAGVRTKLGAHVDAAALKAFLSTRLAKFKIPERIWLRTSELPRGGTGKLGRRALRAECLKTLEAERGRGDDSVQR
ncbi:MAG: long-chain fatty acid--CoA ligase [Burkholderiaceae bacterium]|nr:MAG: long-chain fatty acid--CoA ligase [Burkholderiaceae bacterium]